MGEVVRFRQHPRKVAAYLVIYVGAGIALGFVFANLIARIRYMPTPSLVAIDVLMLLAIVLAVGSVRAQVEFDDREVRIRGVVFRRRIPREQVRGVGGSGVLPTIKWVDAHGRSRWSAVCALEIYGLLEQLAPGETERRAQFVRALDAWAEGGAPAAGFAPDPA